MREDGHVDADDERRQDRHGDGLNGVNRYARRRFGTQTQG